MGRLDAGLIVLLLVGMLLIGTGEELAFRGYLVVGARTRFSEHGACLFTCALFGLIHAGNVVTGQALGESIAQMILDVILDMSFHLLRRMSGPLTVPIAAHGLGNFSLYLDASAP